MFRDEQWKVLRKHLNSMFGENAGKTGKRLVNGHKASSDDDPLAIGTARSKSFQFVASSQRANTSRRFIKITCYVLLR